MNLDHEEGLINEFSGLLSYLDFGIECGDGWFALIRDLCQRIKEECAVRGIVLGGSEDEPCLYATQVKEKYGTLRFYTNTCYDWLDILINKAEEISEETCEACGKEGKLRKGAWQIVSCDDCWRKE